MRQSIIFKDTLIFDTPTRPRLISNYMYRPPHVAVGCIVNATQVPNRALLSFRCLHLPDYLRTVRQVLYSDGFIVYHIKKSTSGNATQLENVRHNIPEDEDLFLLPLREYDCIYADANVNIHSDLDREV